LVLPFAGLSSGLTFSLLLTGLFLARSALGIVLGLVAGDLAVDLVGEVVELALGPAERGGLVAEDGLGRLVDALAELLDPLAGAPRELVRLAGDAGVNELPGRLEGLGELLLVGLADGVIQPPGQERLGVLGLLGRVPHAVEDLLDPVVLLRDALAELL